MASDNNSVICDEVFEEGCQPSDEEILEYAVRIGISPDSEPHLLHLARDGLMQALPSDYKVCFHKTQGIYYYNLKSKQSQWEHPLDELYKRLVENTRPRAADPDDQSSLVDSGIRSLSSTTATNTTTSTSAMDGFLRPGARALAPLDRRAVKLQPLDVKPKSAMQATQLPATATFTTQQPIDLKMPNTSAASELERATTEATPVRGLQLFGTGSMFLKSNARKTEDSRATTETTASNWSAASVKGILRDSSLSDVKSRERSLETHRLSESEVGDAAKSVRFNLARRTGDIEVIAKSSDDSSSNDDDDDEDEVDNVADGIVDKVYDGESPSGGDEAGVEVDEEWDFMQGDRKTTIPDSDAHKTKPNAPKLSLRSQFSLDDYRKAPTTPLRKLDRTYSTDSASNNVGHLSSFFDRKVEKNMMASVKPLYDDTTTDSESAISAKQSKIADGTVEDDEISARATIRRQMSDRLEQFRREMELDQKQQEDSIKQQMQQELDDLRNNLSDKMPRGSDEKELVATREQLNDELSEAIRKVREEHAIKTRSALATEELALQRQYEAERRQIEDQHQQRMTLLTDEFQQNTDEYQVELETRQNLEISNYEQKLKMDFDKKQSEISIAHRAAVDTLQRNHTEIFNDLERDLKSEAELLRKEHANNLAQVRVKLDHELEVEKQRMRDSGELQQFEKLRCEKRLLEDKYRCLKDKYVRLKTDVKLRLERQGHSRRSQHVQQQPQQQPMSTTTGSETDRSFSLNHKSGEGSGHGADAIHRNNATQSSSTTPSTTAATTTPDLGKPPQAPVTPQLSSRGRSRDKSRERRSSGATSATREHSGTVVAHKPFGAAAKYLAHLHPTQQQQQQQQQQHSLAVDDTTSFSQSDTTVSNNFSHAPKAPKFLPAQPALGDNGNSDSEAFRRNQENNNHASRDSRKKQFTRLKSASTSRLNASPGPVDGRKALDVHQAGSAASGGGGIASRPCTPMESLRRQLQKLEDLEDQFPENTLLLDATHPYHLRYPFKDVHLADGQTAAGTAKASATLAGSSSSELEFIKHRIHMERDSVRRAKEALRTQRSNFRMRQREIKHSQGGGGKLAATTEAGNEIGGGASDGTAAALDVQMEEAKELTDLEVSLHRMRALLGEKVIRLRALEQSLQRIYVEEKPTLAPAHHEAVGGGGGAHRKHHLHQKQHHHHQQQQQHMLLLQQRDEATVSDLSSHSSSGFSSTEYATDTLHTKRGEGAAVMAVDSMDIVQSLEHLNAEIREIWEILSKQRTTQGLPPPPTMSMDWPGTVSNAPPAAATFGHANFMAKSTVGSSTVPPVTPPAPTFFDRLETYRQFAAVRGGSPSAGGGGLLATLAANTIVSQTPMPGAGGGGGSGGGYTSSLVERTQDLRNWLRQAKNEHEMLSAGPQTDL